MQTHGNLVKPSAANWALGLGLVALGGALAAGGIHLGETDDAPGAALLGIVPMIGLVVLGVRVVRRKR